MKKLIKISSTAIIGVSILFSGLVSGLVMAAPKIQLNISAEKEVVELDKKGKEMKKRVAAEETVPGDRLFYTISFNNSGDEVATEARIDNPIPDGTAYIGKSVWGENSDILFSIDDGKSFDKPSKLTYEVTDSKGKTKTKTAEPEKYTHIRWVISEIPAGSEGSVGYTVLVQ